MPRPLTSHLPQKLVSYVQHYESLPSRKRIPFHFLISLVHAIKVCGSCSNRVLPPSSGGHSRGIARACIVLGVSRAS